MKNDYWKVLAIGLVAVFALVTLVVICINKIAGGDTLFERMVAAIAESEYIQQGSTGKRPSIVRSDGPWEVQIGTAGYRDAYYSVVVSYPKTREALKVYWVESSDNRFSVTEIYRTAPFRSDELIWKAKSPNRN